MTHRPRPRRQMRFQRSFKLGRDRQVARRVDAFDNSDRVLDQVRVGHVAALNIQSPVAGRAPERDLLPPDRFQVHRTSLTHVRERPEHGAERRDRFARVAVRPHYPSVGELLQEVGDVR